MHYKIPAFMVLTALAAAAPSPAPADPWEGVMDPWGQYGQRPGNTKRGSTRILEDHINIDSSNAAIVGEPLTSDELHGLAKRSIGDFVGKVPGCGDDPSKKNTPKPAYKVNQGIKIPKDGDDDECTHGYGANHCWTEYFLVESAVEYFSWEPAEAVINCGDDPKDSCSHTYSSLNQTCTTTGTSTTKGWDWKILDLAVKLNFNIPKVSDITLGTSVNYNYANTKQDLTQTCRQNSAVATCTWSNDGADPKNKCHQAWYADRMLHVWGQAQRTCNKCSTGDVQQNTGDGRVCVRGQKEFDFYLPLNKIIQCAGRCNTNNSGLPQPPNTERMPYKTDVDWSKIAMPSF